MSTIDLCDWCAIQIGDCANPHFGEKCRSLDELLLSGDPITLTHALRVWAGLLLVLDWLHKPADRDNASGNTGRLLLRAHLSRWCVELSGL